MSGLALWPTNSQYGSPPLYHLSADDDSILCISQFLVVYICTSIGGECNHLRGIFFFQKMSPQKHQSPFSSDAVGQSQSLFETPCCPSFYSFWLAFGCQKLWGDENKRKKKSVRTWNSIVDEFGSVLSSPGYVWLRMAGSPARQADVGSLASYDAVRRPAVDDIRRHCPFHGHMMDA